MKKTQPDVSSRSNLEIKVCVRTYRFFYVTNTEDFLWKYRSKGEMESCFKRLKKRDELRREWMKKLEQGPIVPVAAVPKETIPAPPLPGGATTTTETSSASVSASTSASLPAVVPSS